MNISHITTDKERAFYASRDVALDFCRFEGAADGESALKESRDLTLSDCFFALRYPLWHVENCSLRRCEMTETCRAALWYATRVSASDCLLHGTKVLRESKQVSLEKCDMKSEECGWFCRDVRLSDVSAAGDYFLFHASQIEAKNLTFSGKYSFQYTENVLLDACTLDTKDAFWHAENVTVRNSVIKGEYLGWYSNGLTLINCRIEGTQPLCYCKRLTLINCTVTHGDLAFEYSDVCASVRGKIDSVKNPCAGHIEADEIGEIIRDEHARGTCEIIVR